MDGVKQAVKRRALGLAEYVTPVLRESKFRETGVITPEEFTTAGDFLVHHCPTWQWATGDKTPKNYLPAEKQYLLTRNVPCYKRINRVNNHDEDFEKLVEGDGEDGWVDTHYYAAEYADDREKPTELSIESTTTPGRLRDATSAAGLAQGLNSVNLCSAVEGENDDDQDEDEDEEPEDMEEFIQSGMLDELDPATMVTTPSKAEKAKTTAGGKINRITDQQEFIEQTRTYDLYITYDKYYQTPRMWLCGYDEHRRPLSEEQMFEDFSQDHVKRTVTMEQHPHLSGSPMPSIHPCKQAEVMRKLMDVMADAGSGNQLAVHQYLMIFLKFVQAVIPTLEYDYTRNFNMS